MKFLKKFLKLCKHALRFLDKDMSGFLSILDDIFMTVVFIILLIISLLNAIGLL